jgi:phosphoadenosine phosphosulfate reductase
MSFKSAFNRWLTGTSFAADEGALQKINDAFGSFSTEQRVLQAMELLPGAHVLTSSFGAQAAVMLHLVNRLVPRIPVILIDTGYLFPETYRFVDDLTARLDLNLKVVRSDASPAWQESRFGKLWDQGLPGIEQYNRINKQQPLDKAFSDLGAETWFSGLRRTQAASRAQIAPIEFKRGRYKVHPLFDWTDRDVGRYLSAHDLPYHPLWEKGYLSIGDWHTTRSLAEVDSMEELRFFGLKRECGLHEG